jgi:hypothetical protein
MVSVRGNGHRCIRSPLEQRSVRNTSGARWGRRRGDDSPPYLPLRHEYTAVATLVTWVRTLRQGLSPIRTHGSQSSDDSEPRLEGVVGAHERLPRSQDQKIVRNMQRSRTSLTKVHIYTTLPLVSHPTRAIESPGPIKQVADDLPPGSPPLSRYIRHDLPATQSGTHSNTEINIQFHGCDCHRS